MAGYGLTLVTFALIFGALAVSYNISLGFVSLLSISHAAFFAIGAYAYAVLSTQDGATDAAFLQAAGLGILLAALIATGLGLLLIALPEQYVIIGTLALQVTFTTVLTNWTGLTNGIQGIAGVPAPSLFGLTFDTPWSQLGLAAALVVLTLGIAEGVLRSPLGITLRAARDDAAAAAAAGIAVQPLRIAMFALGASLAALAGSVYAGVIGFIDPGSFTVDASIQFLSMVVIGGLGSPLGALLGGVIIALLPSILQEFSLAMNAAATVQQLLFGVAMTLMVVLRPHGLLPERRLLTTGEVGR